jgi:hypothetical protein
MFIFSDMFTPCRADLSAAFSGGAATGMFPPY